MVSIILTARSGRMKVSKLRHSMSYVAGTSSILRVLSWSMNSLSTHILSASRASYTPLIRSYSSLIYLGVTSSCLCFLALSFGYLMPSCFIAFSTIFRSNSLLSMLSFLIQFFCKPNCIHLLPVMC